MPASRSTVKLTAPTYRRFVHIQKTGGFSGQQAFVKHLLDEEERRQLQLKVSRFPPDQSTPVARRSFLNQCPLSECSPVSRANVSTQSPLLNVATITSSHTAGSSQGGPGIARCCPSTTDGATPILRRGTRFFPRRLGDAYAPGQLGTLADDEDNMSGVKEHEGSTSEDQDDERFEMCSMLKCVDR